MVVYYWGGNQACFGLQRVDVAILADGAPSITVWEGTHPDAIDMVCTMEALLKSTVVTLDQPLIVDGNQPRRAGRGAGARSRAADRRPSRHGVLDPIPVRSPASRSPPMALTVTAQWYGGVPECYGVAAATITTSARPFVVSMFEGRVPGSEVCIDIALAKGVVFVLDSPLIRDGSLAR